jgi:hypothetical protein
MTSVFLAASHSQTQLRELAAAFARGLHQNCPSKEKREQGKPGARSTRSPCATKMHTVVTTVAPEITRLFDDQSKPGWADLISARLSISNGCQDHTTSPYAATSANSPTDHVLSAEFWPRREASFVLRAVAHSRDTALRTHSRARRCRVHRIPSRVRDDRDPPLLSGWDNSADRTESTWLGSGIFLNDRLDDPNHLGIVAINRRSRNLPRLAAR